MTNKTEFKPGTVYKDMFTPSKPWRVMTAKGPLHLLFKTKRDALRIATSFKVVA